MLLSPLVSGIAVQGGPGAEGGDRASFFERAKAEVWGGGRGEGIRIKVEQIPPIVELTSGVGRHGVTLDEYEKEEREKQKERAAFRGVGAFGTCVEEGVAS